MDFATDQIIKNALIEDIGTGDITTISAVPENLESTGRIIAKESGIDCGTQIAKRTFELVGDNIKFEILKKDGESVVKGDIIAKLYGNARSLLTGERTALNFMQRLSGIATLTAKTVNAVKGTKAKICDTRKTAPGLRILEKYAVKTGGGSNHRFNLSDGILIKDNHIKAAGGIKQAVDCVRKTAPHTLKIEVETENMDMIAEALAVGADIIMLDNMSVQQMEQAVKLIGGKAISEASGNMGDKDLLSIAKTGVDLISIGALTHSAKALDISLKFD